MSGATESTRPGTTAASQISNFKMKERAVEKLPFKTFYTAGEREEIELEEGKKRFYQLNSLKSEVKFDRQNKFSGKSSYVSYIPAKNHIDERKLEAVWWQHQNKKL